MYDVAMSNDGDSIRGDDRTERIIEQQREEIERLRALFASTGEGTAEHKYLDALRRNKALNVKLESEKTKSSNLTRQLEAVESRLLEAERLQAQCALPTTSPSKTGYTDGDDDGRKELREAKTALDKATRSNAELRRQLATQKQDLTRLREVLRKEVGDSADLDKIGGEDGDGWRGRAQQITLLKGKLKEVQRQLRDATPSELASALGKLDTRSIAGTTNYAPSSAGGTDFDEVHRRALEGTAATRRARDAAAAAQAEESERQAKLQKERADAAVARVSVLEKENAAMRSQLQRVIAKTENDDQLISAYKQELETKRIEHRDALQQVQKLRHQLDFAPTSGSPTMHRGGDAAVMAAAAAAEPSDFFQQRIAELDRALKAEQSEVAELRGELAEAQLKVANQHLNGDAPPPPPPSDGLGRVWEEEAGQLREYAELLRNELTRATDEVERLHAEAHTMRNAEQSPPRDDGGARPVRREKESTGKPTVVDVASLPPDVVARVNGLKGENTSLKERVAFLQRTMDREVAVWRDVADRQRIAWEDAERRRTRLGGTITGSEAGDGGAEGTHCGDGESQAVLKAELRDLKRQYQELKRAYNGEMQRKLRDP